MNLQQLRIFAQAARLGTLTEAAAELKLKQPTASFHLHKLEETLGVELYRKNIRHLVLTEAGQALLPYAAKVVALLDEAGRVMAEYRDEGRGQLKIGASYSPATYYMPPFLAEFQSRYPKVVPTMTVRQAGDVLELLRRYEVDVCIVSLMDTESADLQLYPLEEDELKLIMPPGHPLGRLAAIDVADLENEHFIVHEHGSTSRELSELWARDNHFALRVRMELGAVETIKESVRHGIALGIVPARAVVRESAGGELAVRDLPGVVRKRYICLAHRKEDVLAQHIRTFIRFMRGGF